MDLKLEIRSRVVQPLIHQFCQLQSCTRCQACQGSLDYSSDSQNSTFQHASAGIMFFTERVSMCVRTCEQTHSSWNELARTHSDSLSVLRGVGISDYALKEKCETLHACFESVLALSSATENINMHHRNFVQLVQLLNFFLYFLKKE